MRLRGVLPFLAFFLSGAAGLMAEIAWIRRAGLAFGSTTWATSSVVAVFFLGLAIGAWAFGRISPRLDRPLRLYIGLELALAALVLASPAHFHLADELYGRAYRAAGGDGLWLAWIRALLVAMVVLPPAVVMGGTLPLFCRQFIRDAAQSGRVAGRLYALNTFGAACGCAVAGFVTIPSLGVTRTLTWAAATGLAAAACATLALRTTAAAPLSQATPIDRSSEPPALNAHNPTFIAALFFATGFVALGHEVLWTRFLSLIVPSTVQTYTTSLLVVLLGIVLGSAATSAIPMRFTSSARLFGALQVATALATLTMLLLPPGAWRLLGSPARTAFVFALVPAIFGGAAFPVAVRMRARSARHAGREVGALLAANTLGGIAGALCIGFWALPRLGLAPSALLTTGTALATGIAAWLVLDRKRGFVPRLAVATAAVAAWLVLPRLLPTRVPADYLADRAALVDFREGREANLAVVRKQGVLQLEADHWWQGQDRKTHQIMAAHVPMLAHPHPRRALVVGVGAGQTPERVLLYDPERLDCVDIEPAVFELVRTHFPNAWMSDPRVHLIDEDGRNFIAHAAARWDVISLEVGQIFRPGAEAFYTREFYRLVRDRLEPGGIVSQFVPLSFLTPEMFGSVLASFIDVFPQAVLWYNSAECLLLGTSADSFAIDAGRLDLLQTNKAIHDDLRFSHWNGAATWLNQPHAFLGGFLCGPRAVQALAGTAPLLHDDRPVLGWATRTVDASTANELPLRARIVAQLDSIATVVRGGPLPDSTLAKAAAIRARNLADLAAAAALRRVDELNDTRRYDELEGLLRGALAANPDNLQANRLLGGVLLLRGRVAEAEAAFAHATRQQAGDAESHFGLARALHVQRRFAAATAEYRAGLTIDATDADAHNNLAAALAEQGQLDEARHHFREALKIRPDFPDAERNLARLEAATTRR